MPRFFLILLTILLYLFAWHQNHPEKKAWDAATVTTQDRKSPAAEAPFYMETFVNSERPGTICHVSSLSPVGDGKMACAWYSGSREGAADVAIYFSVFDEKTQTWRHPVKLLDRLQSSSELRRYVKNIGNPLLFSDNAGRLWLFYSSVAVGGWSGSSLNFKVSSDNGDTWTKSSKMILSPFFNLTENVKNKGLNFDNGSFIVPVYHEFIKKFSQLLLITPDKSSIRYEIRKITATGKAIQPSILHAEGKTMQAFFRNMGDGRQNYILKASSNDLGQRWSGLSGTSLPNPNSGFDMIKLPDSTYLAVINYSFHGRSNLSMIISRDRGSTWKTIKVLENTPGEEFSYPSISRSNSGLFHITYTYERRRIKHIVFNEAWVKNLI